MDENRNMKWDLFYLTIYYTISTTLTQASTIASNGNSFCRVRNDIFLGEEINIDWKRKCLRRFTFD